MAILPAFDCLQQFILLMIDYFSTKKKIFANESINLPNDSAVRVTIYCHQQYTRLLWEIHCLLRKGFWFLVDLNGFTEYHNISAFMTLK